MGNMHRSMQGKMVDMEKLLNQNELMPAIGNVRVNARGDELGPGGQIVKKREDIISEYYDSNPRARSESSQPVQPVQPKQGAPRTTVDTGVLARKGKPTDES